MLHLSKLCVGIRDVGQLRDWQARRTESHPPLRHKTRNAPRRVAEIVEGGSIYWVIAGVMLVRQRIVAIRPDTWDDGGARARRCCCTPSWWRSRRGRCGRSRVGAT